MDSTWTLREFKTSGAGIVPATVKSNPGNDLFSSFEPEDSVNANSKTIWFRQSRAEQSQGYWKPSGRSRGKERVYLRIRTDNGGNRSPE